MDSITEIFRNFGLEYIHRFPDMPKIHRKVISAINNCRSGKYGVAIYECAGCHSHHHVGCACGNRHCPQCQHHKTRDWLNNQLARLLPVSYFMLTFTVPEQIRSFCRSNQDATYKALFKAASGAIKKLAMDQRFIGTNMPGFTGVLHTWGRTLQYHPHLHFIVPGGGLSSDKSEWLSAANAFYLPVKALSKIYRAKFRAEMEQEGLLEGIDPVVWTMNWNVNCQAVGNGEASLKYLAPYVFRVAISNTRIVAVKDRNVTFSYRKTGSNRPRQMTLDVMEFIRRFLQHVLPCGFMKVRHYGFMSGSCTINIAKLRLCILASNKDCVFDLTDLMAKPAPVPTTRPSPTCKACGGLLEYLYSLFPGRTCRGST